MESAEIDKELEELDEKIDKLRAQYEQYFMGIDRIEPQKPRQDVERRLKILRREQIRNTAQRFKFNVLVQRMNTMQQYWGRVVREIENGTFKRDVIRAAARFGDAALAGGKKKSKELAKLVAERAKRAVDDAMELGADDLIEEDDEDEAPTPPKFEHAAARAAIPEIPAVEPDIPSAAVAHYGVPQPQYGVPQQYGAPQPQYAAPYPQYAEPQPQYAAPQPQYGAPQPQYAYGAPEPQYTAPQPQYPAQPHASAAPEAPADAASPPGAGRSSGLRWGSSDPSSSIRTAPVVDVKRRVAELAAEMRAPQRGQESGGSGFGTLDLDFDESPSGRHSDPGTPPPYSGPAGRPLPAASPPRAGQAGLRAGAPQQPAATPPAGGFGVLDIALDGDPSPVPAPSPSSPGSGIRMGGGARPTTAVARPPTAQAPAPQRPIPAAAQPQTRPPAQPAASGADLAEQRMRQIYAKYVETKRSANESTAGVTYEKLAATLRAQAEKLKAQHPSKSIDYEVVLKDGKTHLKPVLK